MPVVFADWQNRNEQRNYPLHDRASKLATNGQVLMDDLLADAHILIPESAGRFVYVSSVGITPGIVSVTFLATDSDPFSATPGPAPTDLVPLAVVTVTKPVDKYRHYAVEPLFPGVGGWVSFGAAVGLEGPISMLFDDPSQTLLTARAARFYKEIPVTSLGRTGAAAALTGLVELRGQAGIIRVREVLQTINGEQQRAIGIGLDLDTDARTTLERFAGPCRNRPDSRNCEGEPFVDVNDVKPDCDGNINIRFDGDPRVELTQVPDGEGCGFVLDFPLGLAQVCEEEPLPDPVDLCASSESPSSESSLLPSSPSLSSLSSSSLVPESPTSLLPEYCEDFGDEDTELETQIGLFTRQLVEFPADDIQTYRSVSAPGTVQEQFVLNELRPLSATIGYTIESVIRPRTNGGSGFLIYAYKNFNNFRFVGWTLNSSQENDPPVPGAVFHGRKLASGDFDYPDGLGGEYFFDSLQNPHPEGIHRTDVRVEVDVAFSSPTERVVTLTFEWEAIDGSPRSKTIIFAVTVDPLDDELDGLAGFGAVASETEFDNFGIDCTSGFGDEEPIP
jgi:hypothetical protein